MFEGLTLWETRRAGGGIKSGNVVKSRLQIKQ